MAAEGRHRPNVESELMPIPDEQERLEADDLVADGLVDEANVPEYNDDDQEGEHHSLDDFAEDQIIK
jgi:hypothetical protein